MYKIVNYTEKLELFAKIPKKNPKRLEFLHKNHQKWHIGGYPPRGPYFSILSGLPKLIIFFLSRPLTFSIFGRSWGTPHEARMCHFWWFLCKNSSLFWNFFGILPKSSSFYVYFSILYIICVKTRAFWQISNEILPKGSSFYTKITPWSSDVSFFVIFV